MSRIDRYIFADPALVEAMEKLDTAKNRFNYADLDTVDAAIYDLAAAELQLRATIQRARDDFFNLPKSNPDKTFYTTPSPSLQLKKPGGNSPRTRYMHTNKKHRAKSHHESTD